MLIILFKAEETRWNSQASSICLLSLGPCSEYSVLELNSLLEHNVLEQYIVSCVWYTSG